MTDAPAAFEQALAVGPELRQQAMRPEGVLVTVAAASMAPTLPVGSGVRVRARRPRVGDVVVYLSASGARAVVHRVVWCAPGVPFLVQGGDAQRHDGRVALIHRRQLVGVADVPRRMPSVAQARGALRLVFARLREMARR